METLVARRNAFSRKDIESLKDSSYTRDIKLVFVSPHGDTEIIYTSKKEFNLLIDGDEDSIIDGL